MHRLAFGALGRVAEDVAVEVVVGTDIEQVVQAERIVQRQRGAGLIAAGGLGAAVVQAQGEAPLLGLHVLDHQVAVARLGTGCGRGLDLDVGLGRGGALEVLQALLDVAQVQQVARAGRNGRAQQGAAAQQRRGRIWRQADGGDAPRH